MKAMYVNTSFFSRGGVIGRMDYFINCGLKAAGFFALAAVPYFVGSRFGQMGTLLGGAASFFGFCAVLVFSFINTFKRLRDIRGTVENQMLLQSILVVVMSLPVVGLLASMYLMFATGKVTGDYHQPPMVDKVNHKHAA